MLFKKILCFFIFAVIAGLFTACDSAGTDYPYGPVSQGNIEALVLNEGGINQNMGGISILNKDGSVIPDIFRITDRWVMWPNPSPRSTVNIL